MNDGQRVIPTPQNPFQTVQTSLITYLRDMQTNELRHQCCCTLLHHTILHKKFKQQRRSPLSTMITTTSNKGKGTAAAAAADAKHNLGANGTKSNLLRGVLTSFTALTLLVTLGISFRYVIFGYHDAKNIMMEAAVQSSKASKGKGPKGSKVPKSDSGGGPPPPPPDVCVWKKDIYCRDPYVYFDFIGWLCPASGTAPGTQVGRYIESDPTGKFDETPVNLDTFVNDTAFYGTIDGTQYLIALQEDTSILQTVDVNDSVTTYSASNC